MSTADHRGMPCAVHGGEGGKERLELFERHLHRPMTMASLRLCKAMSVHEHSRP